ncbi:RTA1 domain-containing protein [Diaporthe helianthi]|uniref:RTA1 domain-containing protein n=1 Tax=Diaporthe helianthi TaxID=158607 RepID=A0A2P5HQE8_DIAHE|nr:RTA1 domain-containing protein [Diaporthe helianthi]
MANHTEQADALEAFLKEIKNAKCSAYNSTLETLYGLDPSYGYVPSEPAGIVFAVLFCIAVAYHTAQYIRIRSVPSILLSIGAFTELIGWGARTYSSRCPYNSDSFLAQEVTLIIAPVFFSAALYFMLGKLIVDLGPASSILSAKWYTILFCTCDFISLVVQAVGGAKASTADTQDEQDQGTWVMLAGVAFQLLTMTFFGLLLLDFMRRVLLSRLATAVRSSVNRAIKLVCLAVVISFIMIYVRSVYRTVELAQGWNGYLITHEAYFIGLDAAIMFVAVGVFMCLDPAVILWSSRRSKDVESKAQQNDTTSLSN